MGLTCSLVVPCSSDSRLCSSQAQSQGKITKYDRQDFPALTKAQKTYQGYCEGLVNPFVSPLKVTYMDENDDETLCEVQTAYSGMTPPTFDPKEQHRFLIDAALEN